MKKIAIINGPNINMLAKREAEIYGDLSLDQIIENTEKKLVKRQVELTWMQSNIEGEIVDKIQEVAQSKYDALIINPAGYSHTSVAILDALKILTIPVVEVHISNIYQRESFRQRLLTAKAASIIMSGLGTDAYYHGILTQLDS